ncbi:MAG: N(4)-(beta-N-acetylglucosaminyl)-L-asparaginase [Planctomycetota bacterium]|nr:N(4)-(beta-N-acetylglucosaminyl)-L-asparaginase [Planctomycetota bacterium]
MSTLSRRAFLGASVAAAGAMGAASGAERPGPRAGARPEARPRFHAAGPVVIASLNGLPATRRAMDLLNEGYDPADAIVQGVRIVEDDPNDDSVGYGGLPNADGVVELDASVMHGPTHKSGAVASVRNIKNVAMVALMVLRRTDHCLLVGEGAYRYARSMGFAHEELLTEHARAEYLNWRQNMSRDDDYLNDDERDAPVGKTWDLLPGQQAPAAPVPRTNDGPDIRDDSPAQGRPRTRAPGQDFIREVTGTVHCSALTAKGDIASCTSTSGLNWKIPGRVGDSPIIGAGNYCDNDIGAAGSTGRGEANIVTLAAARIVDLMGDGLSPEEACLAMCRYVVDRTKEKRLWRVRGDVREPTFDLKFYALRKDGLFGGASLWSGAKMSVCDGAGARVIDVPSLYERAQGR